MTLRKKEIKEKKQEKNKRAYNKWHVLT